MGDKDRCDPKLRVMTMARDELGSGGCREEIDICQSVIETKK